MGFIILVLFLLCNLSITSHLISSHLISSHIYSIINYTETVPQSPCPWVNYGTSPVLNNLEKRSVSKGNMGCTKLSVKITSPYHSQTFFPCSGTVSATFPVFSITAFFPVFSIFGGPQKKIWKKKNCQNEDKYPFFGPN